MIGFRLLTWVILLHATSALAQTVVLPTASASAPPPGRFNQMILQSIRHMPTGGQYSTSSTAAAKLRASHTVTGGILRVRPDVARPSYCSGATYLVLLDTLSELQGREEILLSPEAVAELAMRQQPDGEGVWGRWNANGPGTARLFYELGAGRSFTEIERAQPGDFLKIFWRDAVGKKEAGHSVIFLKEETREGVPGVLFWSSNKPDGYGEKWVPRTKIARMLFTRLERPSAFENALKLPKKDRYLSEMLTRESSFQEALEMCGAR